jgi:hypothetical protein
MENKYYNKYIKYKNKYYNLKKYNIYGGDANNSPLNSILQLFNIPINKVNSNSDQSIKSNILTLFTQLTGNIQLIDALHDKDIIKINKLLKSNTRILYIDLFSSFMKLFDFNMDENTIKNILTQLLDNKNIQKNSEEFKEFIKKINTPEFQFFILILQNFINPNFNNLK